jgi:translation initiation factor 1 (eIF-1/SUI1)
MNLKKNKVSLDADASQLSQGLFGGVHKGVSKSLGPLTKTSQPTTDSHSFKGKRITLKREKAGRGGKVVTLVCDLPNDCDADWQRDFLQRAKQHLGCGGKLGDAFIELQGDCRSQLTPLLQQQGFRVVVAGA